MTSQTLRSPIADAASSIPSQQHAAMIGSIQYEKILNMIVRLYIFDQSGRSRCMVVEVWKLSREV